MISVWPFTPRANVPEKLSWFTNVLQSRTSEDAIALRTPRQSFVYSFYFDDQQMAKAEGLFRANPYGQWMVPVWPERDFISGILSADTNIVADMAADYRVGGKAIIVESDDVYTECDITAVNGGSLDLATPVGADHVSGILAPLRVGFCAGGMKVVRRHFGLTEVSMEFQIVDNLATPATPFAQYLGLDVMSDPSATVGGLSGALVHPVTMIDNGFGPVVIEPLRDVMRGRHSAAFIDAGLAAAWRRKKWLYSINGRQAQFWLPTWGDDLALTAPIGSASNSITVQRVLPTVADYVGKHVSIWDGSASYYREITSAIQSGENHRLYLSPLGVDIALSDARVSFLRKVRSDNDNIQISHKDGMRAEVSLQMIEV